MVWAQLLTYDEHVRLLKDLRDKDQNRALKLSNQDCSLRSPDMFNFIPAVVKIPSSTDSKHAVFDTKSHNVARRRLQFTSFFQMRSPDAATFC